MILKRFRRSSKLISIRQKNEIDVKNSDLAQKLNHKIKQLKEKNNKILQKTLKLESLVEAIAFSSNLYERKSNIESYNLNLLTDGSDKLATLENKIIDLRYLLNSSRNTGNHNEKQINDAFEIAYEIQKPGDESSKSTKTKNSTTPNEAHE